MGDRIGIMGAGALGSYVGAFLSREGEDVTGVDMWPEHVEKMRADGLHVRPRSDGAISSDLGSTRDRQGQRSEHETSRHRGHPSSIEM